MHRHRPDAPIKVEKYSAFDASMQLSANEAAARQKVLANEIIRGSGSIAARLYIGTALQGNGGS